MMLLHTLQKERTENVNVIIKRAFAAHSCVSIRRSVISAVRVDPIFKEASRFDLLVFDSRNYRYDKIIID
jgi:hypothetical protein